MDLVNKRMKFFLTLTLEWLKNHEEEKGQEATCDISGCCVSSPYAGLGP